MKKSSPHNEAVAEFIEKCKRENPEKVAEIFEKYPTISGRQWRRIADREVPLTPALAEEIGIESGYEGDG